MSTTGNLFFLQSSLSDEIEENPERFLMQQQPHVGNSLKRLQAQGRIVVMSGDGINDAAAFGSGTRGNRHGTATDIAIDASA